MEKRLNRHFIIDWFFVLVLLFSSSLVLYLFFSLTSNKSPLFYVIRTHVSTATVLSSTRYQGKDSVERFSFLSVVCVTIPNTGLHLISQSLEYGTTDQSAGYIIDSDNQVIVDKSLPQYEYCRDSWSLVHCCCLTLSVTSLSWPLTRVATCWLPLLSLLRLRVILLLQYTYFSSLWVSLCVFSSLLTLQPIPLYCSRQGPNA